MASVHILFTIAISLFFQYILTKSKRRKSFIVVLIFSWQLIHFETFTQSHQYSSANSFCRIIFIMLKWVSYNKGSIYLSCVKRNVLSNINSLNCVLSQYSLFKILQSYLICYVKRIKHLFINTFTWNLLSEAMKSVFFSYKFYMT